jgi:hypothetical protein
MIKKIMASVCQAVEPLSTNRIKIIWQVIKTAAKVIDAEHHPETVDNQDTALTKSGLSLLIDTSNSVEWLFDLAESLVELVVERLVISAPALHTVCLCLWAAVRRPQRSHAMTT